jgi:AcrR family transcriptional regulator
MARRSLQEPRRNKPHQARSRATVEVILDATIRIFDEEGAEAASTSRVAEVAGVSVGTLYQYFGNRDAILDALQDREFERAQAMMQRVLANPAGVSDHAIARSVIEELFRLYRAAPALHRVLAVEGLRVTPAERVQAFDARIVGAIKAFLVHAKPRIRREHVDAAAFVVYQSVRAAMLAYLIEAPAGVGEAALVDELTDLVVRYLTSAEANGRWTGLAR